MHLSGNTFLNFLVGKVLGYENPKDPSKRIPVSSCRENVVSRIAIPLIIMPCVLIHGTGEKMIRGSFNIVAGLLTLHGKTFLFGLNDLLSAVVEAIVLPLLGIVSIFSPTLTKALGQKINAKCCDEKLLVQGYSEVERIKEGIAYNVRNTLTRTLQRISYSLESCLQPVLIPASLCLPCTSVNAMATLSLFFRPFENTYNASTLSDIDFDHIDASTVQYE